LRGAGTYVAPSLNHAGCVITTSGVFYFLFFALMKVSPHNFSRIGMFEESKPFQIRMMHLKNQ
jgi:hypothetical protein